MLPPLESEVLRIVWKKGEASVRDVWLAMCSYGKRRAYTTIMSVMVRLYQKGFLKRKKHGKRYIYEPAISQADALKLIIRSFIQNILRWFGEPASAYFVEELTNILPTATNKLHKALKKGKGDKKR
ncbi:MAG: hypothetical protein RUDDFDWM_001420 [Candidatus Fervidibacterota bacterium]